jgi:predicted acylesterase/phospholipase RssA
MAVPACSTRSDRCPALVAGIVRGMTEAPDPVPEPGASVDATRDEGRHELTLRAELQRAVDIILHGSDWAGSPPGTPRSDAPRGPAGSSLEDELERVVLPGGATLFRQGDEGDSLAVITSGRLRLVVENEHGDVSYHDLGPDQIVGELALITGEPRNATVIAVRDSVLYRLGRAQFERCASANPAVTHNMLVTLARRVSRPPARRRSAVVPVNIVVLPAGRDAPVREFAEALREFMDGHVPTALVSSASVERAVGAAITDGYPSSDLGVALHEYLGALEKGHDHVVYLADEAATPWTDKCVREADLILLVGRAGTDPTRNVLEDRVFDPAHLRTAPPVHLVLVESAAERTPVGTEPWLRHRPVEMCHHLHLEWRSHFARLARFIVGAPVGLVLSGGAARAFAHIGVLRALRDAAIPIDIVIGTSAGSLIGGQFAMGWSPERIEQVSAEVFGGPKRRLLDLVPPYTSLIGSAGFNASLDKIFGDVRFEDLWMQFLCTTTDLTSATGLTHRRGRLRPFVRASCSLPMVMPPVTHEGHLLADGGIVNNVPVDPLLEVASVGMLIVVNVTSPFYTADEAYNYQDSLSIGRVLNGRFNPFAEKLVAPRILDVLLRSLEIGSKGLEPAQIAKATVYVRPDVARFGYTNITALPDIVAAGEREAVDRLAELGTPSIPFAGSPLRTQAAAHRGAVAPGEVAAD